MKEIFKIFKFVLLMCGVFGLDEDEVKSVSVMEGDSVTLNLDPTQIQGFIQIQWRFGKPGSSIAKIVEKTISYEDEEIFEDRLQLDQTGSLTIKNMRTKHSGRYKAEISHSSETFSTIFIVTVYGSPDVIDAVKGEMKLMSVTEGDPVILQTDVPQLTRDMLVVWRSGDEGKLIAKHDIEAKSSPFYDETDERFRDRLKLDQTGSLTITNTRTTDSGLYRVKISSNNQTTYKRFTVTVSVPDSGLSPGAVAGIVLVLLLAAAVVAAGVIYHRCKISEIQKQAYSIIPETVTFEEGGFASLSSGVTEIQEGDQMLWTFKDETIATMSKKDKTTYYYDRKRFRGRLQLDPQTGSLIIRNFRKTDSGLYQLQIKRKGETTSYRKYQVTVCGEVTTMRVKEKDNVTLKIDLQLESGDDMTWWFRNKMRIASLRKEDEGMKCTDLAGGRFKNRLELDKTGSLTIKNIRPEHIGFYEVKTKRRGMKFSLISDDIQTGRGARQGVFIEKDEMKTVSVKEGGTLKLSTDTEIQADDEIVLMFGSKTCPYEIIARFSLKDQDVFITVSKMLTKRLKLDRTGFLTITITSIKFPDCGDYYVQITNKRNERFKSFTFTVVPNGVFSGDEVKSVSAIEGYSVTLNPDLTQIQKDDLIVWTSGHEGKLIAKSDEECGMKTFRDDLKLDHQTGSLTIISSEISDSGLYELKIIRNTQMMFWRFILTVLDEKNMKSVNETESVTLHIDRSEIQQDDLILWKFKGMILAKNKELCSERDGLELDKKTGSLTIKNITITDCGYYILQIINRKETISKRFKVTMKALLTDASKNIVDDVETVMYDNGVDDWYDNLSNLN